MLVWYKGAGINAVVALPLNLVFILAVLASFGATLTLPGIAGLVLTVGMAVDANVLVFERIREEIAHGKAPRAAVDAGFDRAFWTIFDSHMTALISAVFLYNFGTGPVKGFAVTLGVGLFASIFTAVFVSHSLFDLVFWLWPKSTSLSIAWTTFKSPSFPFMRWKVPFVTVTAILALVSIAFNPWFFVPATLLGLALSGLGGYVCARMAGGAALRAGVILAVLTVALGLLFAGDPLIPLWVHGLLVVLTAAAVMLGVRLGSAAHR